MAKCPENFEYTVLSISNTSFLKIYSKDTTKHSCISHIWCFSFPFCNTNEFRIYGNYCTWYSWHNPDKNCLSEAGLNANLILVASLASW